MSDKKWTFDFNLQPERVQPNGTLNLGEITLVGRYVSPEEQERLDWDKFQRELFAAWKAGKLNKLLKDD